MKFLHSIVIFSLQLIASVSAGCSGAYDLPVQIGSPNTRTFIGKKTYLAPDVHSLANQLMLDIPSLTLAYANVLAMDAFYIEENYEITYRFFIAKGTADLNQFKIQSTTLGDKKVNIEWNIARAYLSFTAHRNVKIHRNRRRRRWIGGGRRRCTWKKLPRGVTKYDIKKIQGTLTATMNKVSSKSSIFVQKRIIDMKLLSSRKKAKTTCSAWKPVINIPIARGCLKRSAKIPRQFTKPYNPKRKPTIPRIRYPVRRPFIRKGGREDLLMEEY